MELTITLNGVERTYKGDYDTLYNIEWNDVVRDIIDSATNEEEHATGE